MLWISNFQLERSTERITLADLSFVAEHFWYISLLGRAIAGLSCGLFLAILPTYIQEPFLIGMRSYLQRFKRENG